MSFLKSHPIFSGIMFALAVVLGAEILYLVSLRQAEAALALETEQKIGRINVLQRARPGLTQHNLLLAKEDLEQSQVVLATMLRTLGVTQQDELEYFQNEPVDTLGAYFDISEFVVRMQAKAAEVGVRLSDGERFGFASYVSAGPDAPALIRTVYRQRRILEYLLLRLLESRPQSLVSVQREMPPSASQAGANPASTTRNQPQSSSRQGGSASDYFVIDPQVSARTPGYVDTMAFRLIFVGQTSALRSFMNALAEPGLPLVVRSVEVQMEGLEPVAPGGRPNRPNSASSANAEPEPSPTNVPIVPENDARFTVTVEMFEVQIQ